MNSTQKLTFTALFIALGLLLPMAFHMVGGSMTGKLFLPMHIPVLLAGFLVGPAAGAVVGLITPGLSSVLTGMPPMVPMVPLMTVELFIYGLLAGLTYRFFEQSLLPSLLISMAGGRVVYGILGAFVLPLFGLQKVPLWAPITAGVLSSWPGIAVQLVVIPLIVSAAESLAVFNSKDASSLY